MARAAEEVAVASKVPSASPYASMMLSADSDEFAVVLVSESLYRPQARCGLGKKRERKCQYIVPCPSQQICISNDAIDAACRAVKLQACSFTYVKTV